MGNAAPISSNSTTFVAKKHDQHGGSPQSEWRKFHPPVDRRPSSGWSEAAMAMLQNRNRYPAVSKPPATSTRLHHHWPLSSPGHQEHPFAGEAPAGRQANQADAR